MKIKILHNSHYGRHWVNSFIKRFVFFKNKTQQITHCLKIHKNSWAQLEIFILLLFKKIYKMILYLQNNNNNNNNIRFHLSFKNIFLRK